MAAFRSARTKRAFLLFVVGTQLFTSAANSSEKIDRRKLDTALAPIPAASGRTVLARINQCGIKIQRNTSWIASETLDQPQIGARAGDEVIQVVMDVPPMRGDEPSLYRDLTARWIIRDGKARPDTGWADQLQNKPAPFGSPTWMNCYPPFFRNNSSVLCRASFAASGL
jgi:hypothetical protein